MTTRILALVFLGLLVTACASREDRQWRDLQTILEHQERAR